MVRISFASLPQSTAPVLQRSSAQTTATSLTASMDTLPSSAADVAASVSHLPLSFPHLQHRLQQQQASTSTTQAEVGVIEVLQHSPSTERTDRASRSTMRSTSTLTASLATTPSNRSVEIDIAPNDEGHIHGLLWSDQKRFFITAKGKGKSTNPNYPYPRDQTCHLNNALYIRQSIDIHALELLKGKRSQISEILHSNGGLIANTLAAQENGEQCIDTFIEPLSISGVYANYARIVGLYQNSFKGNVIINGINPFIPLVQECAITDPDGLIAAVKEIASELEQLAKNCYPPEVVSRLLNNPNVSLHVDQDTLRFYLKNAISGETHHLISDAEYKTLFKTTISRTGTRTREEKEHPEKYSPTDHFRVVVRKYFSQELENCYAHDNNGAICYMKDKPQPLHNHPIIDEVKKNRAAALFLLAQNSNQHADYVVHRSIQYPDPYREVNEYHLPMSIAIRRIGRSIKNIEQNKRSHMFLIYGKFNLSTLNKQIKELSNLHRHLVLKGTTQFRNEDWSELVSSASEKSLCMISGLSSSTYTPQAEFMEKLLNSAMAAQQHHARVIVVDLDLPQLRLKDQLEQIGFRTYTASSREKCYLVGINYSPNKKMVLLPIGEMRISYAEPRLLQPVSQSVFRVSDPISSASSSGRNHKISQSQLTSTTNITQPTTHNIARPIGVYPSFLYSSIPMGIPTQPFANLPFSFAMPSPVLTPWQMPTFQSPALQQPGLTPTSISSYLYNYYDAMNLVRPISSTHLYSPQFGLNRDNINPPYQEQNIDTGNHVAVIAINRNDNDRRRQDIFDESLTTTLSRTTTAATQKRPHEESSADDAIKFAKKSR